MLPTTLFLLATTTLMADPADVALKRADELAAVGKFGEAEKLYDDALASAAPYTKRQAYDGLIRLYIRSGRDDKAITRVGHYEDWLRRVGDTASLAELNLIVGDCRLRFGYGKQAEEHLEIALKATPALPPGKRLEALRLRAEVAAFQQDKREQERWEDLGKAAEMVIRDAATIRDVRVYVTASRYLCESKLHRRDEVVALAILEPLPKLHKQLADQLGLRDTQRLRAKLLSRKDFAKAAELFKEAFDIHQKTQPTRRMVAGDILTEWAAAASANGQVTDAAQLRSEASVEYRAVLNDRSANPYSGDLLAAFIRLQQLNRLAQAFKEARHIHLTDGIHWWGDDPLLAARLAADRGGLELTLSEYLTSRDLLNKALKAIDATDPPNLRALAQVLVNLTTAELEVSTLERETAEPATSALERANQRLNRCDRLYQTHRLPTDLIRVECEYLLGVTAARRGEFSEAVKYFENGIEIANRFGVEADAVRFNLWLNSALIHKEQGELPLAEFELEKAFEVLKASKPSVWDEALFNTVRADLWVTQGGIDKIDKARGLVEAIEQACDNLGHSRNSYQWTTCQNIRGLYWLNHKNIPEAEKTWLALEKIQRNNQSVFLRRTLNYLGFCAEHRGQDLAATAYFEEAKTCQGAHPVTEAITLWRLARLKRDIPGKKDDAKKLLNDVFDLADTVRLNTFGGAAERAQFFAQFTPAFEQAAKWAAEDGDGERLLRVIARSRSRALLDQMLAANVDPRDRLAEDARCELNDRETQARANLAKLQFKVMLAPPGPRAEPLRTEVETAQKELTAVLRDIAKDDPVTRVLTEKPGFADASIEKVRQKVHAAGGALLVYMLGRDKSYAVLWTDGDKSPEVIGLTVAKGAADVLRNPLLTLPPNGGPPPLRVKQAAIRQPEDIRRALIHESPLSTRQPPRPVDDTDTVDLTQVVAGGLVDHYLDRISKSTFDPNKGISLVFGEHNITTEALGDAVLPLTLRDKILASGAKRLVVIPDGGLHKLPLEALRISGRPGTSRTDSKYALEELPAICYAPSLTMLAAVMERPRSTIYPATLLTVSNPDYSRQPKLKPLPGSVVESDRISRCFLPERVTSLRRESATEANVVAKISGKRVIHMAVHGFADETAENPFAAIFLTPPPPGRGTPDSDNDGSLYLHEINRLQLVDCELTILSACRTSVGPQRPLEAGVTLAGAFLSAGSQGVMASYWLVDDSAAPKLMATYFELMEAYYKTGARNEAKPGHAEALKEARLKVKATPGWEAPFYWAAFAYLGAPE